MNRTTATIFGFMTCAAVMGSASAEGYPTMYIPAVDACQGALPNFETSLRKRPLGVANESNGLTFISCGLPRPNSQSFITSVFASATNTGTSNATIRCTLVDGFPTSHGGTPIYVAKELTLAPGQGDPLYWDTSDIGKANFDLVQMSCALPPQTEINYFIQGIPSN